MSYDLGCFAECLECELCDDWNAEPGAPLPGVPPDFYDHDHDGDGVPDWIDPDWGPDPDDDG